VQVGRHTYGHNQIKVHFGRFAELTIGNFCSIAPRCDVFLGGDHRVDWVSTFPFRAFPEHWPNAVDIGGHPTTRGDVTVGNDVWIAWDTTIMSGVTIGDGAVIAARSTVTKDVPPYAIVGGNPASVLRYRFDPHQIEALLAIRWWDWSDDRIAASVPQLCSGDVDAFIAANLPAA
jgi:acetyltransferase-like isoleucine patch superfamily enzyme